MPLPIFSLGNEVSADTAKQDHIYVTFKSWIISGTSHDIDALRHFIAAPPESARHGNPQDVMAAWGHLFNRPQQHGEFHRPLSIREEPIAFEGASFPPPLFSGAWKFAYYPPDNQIGGQSEYSVPTKLELHLNPTRYARYQGITPLPPIAPNISWPEPILYAERSGLEAGDEAVLNANDNWLPQTARWMAFVTPARWRRHLRTYIDAVTKELRHELERVTTAHSTPVAHYGISTRRYILYSAENYWEFLSENPIALVASLEPLLRSFSAKCCESIEIPVENPTTGVFHNSLCLKAKAGQGRQIRIYAKTNQRVRIEVVHYFHSKNCFAVDGGHTGFWHELAGKLEQLAEDAAELVNRMLLHFKNQNEVTPAHIPAYQLLLEIAQHSPDFSTAITIASALIGFKRIAVGGNGTKVQKALRNLKEAQILKYDTQAETYVVTPPRCHGLRMLQEHGNFSLLTARIRKRNLTSP